MGSTVLPLVFFVGLLYGVQSSCPSGTYEIAQDSKCVGIEKSVPGGYFEAECNCVSKGGHLVSLKNSFDSAVLVGMAAEANLTMVYLGADNLHGNGSWTWRDGNPMVYNKWARGQPSSAGHCVAVSTSDYAWHTVDCAAQLPYFCEVPAPKTNCSEGWTEYNGFCYNLVCNQLALYTWEQAQGACQYQNANLASVQGMDENRFLAGVSKFDAQMCRDNWIGLRCSSSSSSGTYSWTDNTPFNFSNATNCPYSPTVYAIRGVFYNEAMYWKDYYTSSRLNSFICKKKAN